MEQREKLKIVVDAGHGGWDNGASWQGRLEKDDNLRLALEVQKQMEAQGVDVIMTRDTDIFVELADRADIANEADADLFISLHRNSYVEQTVCTNGVENWIYLTAPENTERAASLVLGEVVNVGVQSTRGVRRGDYSVVRRTKMPAMLLEMGYIINEEDNRLFDENLVPYAQAITRGALEHFGVPYMGEIPAPAPLPPPQPAVCMAAQVSERDQNVMDAQDALNGYLGGNFGDIAGSLIREISVGDRGEAVTLIQRLLTAKGYDVGGIDGVFGPRTKTALQMYQRDNYLTPDGIAGPLTIRSLLR